MRVVSIRPRVCTAVVALLLVSLVSSTVAATAASGQFYDRDGRPLPFSTFAEVEQFLEQADIVSKEKMSSGTNKHKRKVLLEHGGVSTRAIIRTSYEIKDTPQGGFVDSYMSDLAAYRMALLLGLDNVPPVVRRKGGSLQIWIEKATTDAARRKAGEEPSDPEAFEQQLMDMYVFDSLIANTDRNPGNIIIADNGRIWLIDQTRSFAGQEDLRYLDKIEGCSRALWDRLQSLSDEEVRDAVTPFVKKHLPELLLRRRMLVDALAQKIDAAGEENFLFESKSP